jgi:hypothetical protein
MSKKLMMAFCVAKKNRMIGQNHSISQTRSFPQIPGRNITLYFGISILNWKVLLTCLPQVFIYLFQGEIFQSVEPAELY